MKKAVYKGVLLFCLVYLRGRYIAPPPIFTAKPPPPLLILPLGGSHEGNCISCNNYTGEGRSDGGASEEYFFSRKILFHRVIIWLKQGFRPTIQHKLKYETSIKLPLCNQPSSLSVSNSASLRLAKIGD